MQQTTLCLFKLMTMTLAQLVARPRMRVVPTEPELQRMPTQEDWANNHAEIERLYVRDRRKLRFIMRHMEREHGFKAT